VRLFVPALLLSCDPSDEEDGSDDGSDTDATTTGECVPLEPLLDPLPPDCSVDLPPCGGDPVGVWTRLRICEDGDSILFTQTTYEDDTCEDDVILLELETDTTLVIDADGTLTSEGFLSAILTWEVPAACLATLELPDCEVLASEYHGDCVADQAGGCLCTLRMETASVRASGSWDTCDGSLRVHDASATATVTYSGSTTTSTSDSYDGVASSNYCVNGDTLWIGADSEDPTTYEEYTRASR
jgi:hypothetical protein